MLESVFAEKYRFCWQHIGQHRVVLLNIVGTAEFRELLSDFGQGERAGQGYRKLHFVLSSYLDFWPLISDFLSVYFIFLICKQALTMLGLHISVCSKSEGWVWCEAVITPGYRVGSLNSCVYFFHCCWCQKSKIKLIVY